MGNLIVVDDEYHSLSTAYKGYGTAFEDVYQQYVAILNTILQNAITSGDVYENLSSFASSAKILEGQFQQAVDLLAQYCDSFVSGVDSADQFVYGG